MKVVTLPLLGQPTERATGTSDQRFINALVEIIPNPATGEKEAWSIKRPSLQDFTSLGSGTVNGRGVYAWGATGKMYAVGNNRIYSNGVAIGATLAGTSGMVSWLETPASTGQQMLIVSDGTDNYNINTLDNVVVIDESDDTDYPTPNLVDIVYLDGYTFQGKSNGRLYNFDLNSFTSVGAASFLSVDTRGGDLIGYRVQKDQVIAFTKNRGEFFFNNGNPSGSPLLRIDQNTLGVGCAARQSIAASGEILCFVGENPADGGGGRAVWMITSLGKVNEISGTVQNKLLDAEGTNITSCTSWMERVRGQLIYVLNLASADKTLVYNVDNNTWTEWEAAAGGRFSVVSVTSKNGVIYGQDATNGKIYTLSSTVFQDGSTAYTWTAQTGQMYHDFRERKFIPRVDLIANTTPVNALDLPGSSGNYASTPDAATLDITGDIDLRALVAMDDWTPAVTSAFVGKFTTAGDQRSYLLRIQTSGELLFTMSTDGTVTNQSTATSTVQLAFTSGSPNWVRVTRASVSGNTIFYTSNDGIEWTQVGATVVLAAGSSIFSSSAVLNAGAFNAGADGLWAGKLYRAQVYSGIGGTLVADFNASFMDAGATSYMDATGKTWTINTSGSPAAEIVVDSNSKVSGLEVGLVTNVDTTDDDYQSFVDRGDFDMSRPDKKVRRLGSHKGGRAYRLTNSSNRDTRAQALVITEDSTRQA